MPNQEQWGKFSRNLSEISGSFRDTIKLGECFYRSYQCVWGKVWKEKYWECCVNIKVQGLGDSISGISSFLFTFSFVFVCFFKMCLLCIGLCVVCWHFYWQEFRFRESEDQWYAFYAFLFIFNFLVKETLHTGFAALISHRSGVFFKGCLKDLFVLFSLYSDDG